MILIGSRALAYWNKNFKCKDNTDWDVICSDVEFEKLCSSHPDKRWEQHKLDTLNNVNILKFASDELYPFKNNEIGLNLGVMTMTGLAVLKRSHLHRPRFFNKHISMYHHHGMAKIVNDGLVGSDKELLDERIRLTKDAYGDRVPSLKMGNDEFFNDPIRESGLYVFDHDDIHVVVAHTESHCDGTKIPMYEFMKKPDNESKESAWCERDMWDNFTHEMKIQTVLEESYVIALERFLIPEKSNINPQYVRQGSIPWTSRSAFAEALSKVCTTLCSGFFRDFAIDNWLEIVKTANMNYDQLFFSSYLWKNRNIQV